MPLSEGVDRAFLDWVVSHRWRPLNDLFVGLGYIDKAGLVWIGLALGSAVAARASRSIALLPLVTAATVWTADSISFAVKDVVQRARPDFHSPAVHPLLAVHSSSFPAGHAATSAAGALLLSFRFPRAWPLFLALAAAIAYSRLYVGVHYPSDVAAGAAIGVVCAGVAILLWRLADRRLGSGGRETGIGTGMSRARLDWEQPRDEARSGATSPGGASRRLQRRHG